MLIKINSVVIFAVFSAFGVFGQQNENSFDIVNLGSEYSENQIKDALNGANLCGFYYVDEKRRMQFEDGSIVELKNSQDLEEVSQNCFIEKSPAHEHEYWKIAENGHLIRVKQAYGK